MSDLIGKSLGKYQIVVRVGRGGMARVYKAYQKSLDRYVALKILHSHLAEEQDFVNRFEREATAVARLRHPNIVQVYDYDVDEDHYFIVMEFVEGPTLKSEMLERVKQQEIRPGEMFRLDEISNIFESLGSAIDYAHARGMIHRDLKPGNIMFTFDGQVLLTDFGLARMIYADRQTKTGALSGTPAYMSPEQVEGKRVDERSDVYSLGVILYEMVTGRIPFEADTPYAIMSKHVTDDALPPSQFNDTISPEFEAVILKVLSKDPESRYQSAGNLAAAIRQVLGKSTPVSGEESTFAPIATLADNQEMLSISTQIGGPITSLGNEISPYRGLFAFREEDAPYFFGRELFAEQLRQRLRDHSLVALIGPSGSGKSSVVFAGLLPGLREESNWTSLLTRPGSRPFNALADAVITALKPEINEAEHLAETNSLTKALVTGEISLVDVLLRIVRKNEPNGRVLIVVDQFEELYTLCKDEEIKQRYSAELIDAALKSQDIPEVQLNIILTLRADFMGQALADRPLSDALQNADVKLGPMNRAELGRAVESPAGKLGLVYEAGLVERILDDVGDEPGNLPLLEFALTLLWEQRLGRRLTHAAYETIGRVEGSLARYADQIYENLSLPNQDRAKRVFTQLVRPGEGTEDTRRVASRDDLSDEHWELVRKLADARLIVTARSHDGQETAEIVHEALIHGWGRLREWMKADRSFRVWQERMRVALHQWEDSQRDEGILLRGVLLAEAKEWLADKRRDLSSNEVKFIETSIDLEKRKAADQELQRQRELEQARELADEQQRRAEAEFRRAEVQTRSSRRLRVFAIVLAVVFVMAVIAAIFAIGESQEAAEQADARTTEVFVRITAESEAMSNAEIAAERAEESAAARVTAEAERSRANDSANEAIQARDEAQTERDRADEQAKLALARQLSAQSSSLQGPQLDLALLLSLEANYLSDSSETRSSILSALQSSPALITYLRGHEGLVQSIDFSPDGTLLATAGTEGKVLLWDVETGDEVASLDGHDPAQLVNRAVFNPDGTILASASDDQAIIIWDVATLRPQKTLLGHSSWVQTLAFSPDGEVVASGGGDRVINLWDVESGELQQTLRGHNGPIWDLDFSPSGRLLASASADATGAIWDTTSGEVIRDLTGHNAAVLAISFDELGGTIATGGADNNIRLWDVTTGDQIGTPLSGHLAQVIDLAFSPDGRRLASTGIDSTVRLWDVASHQQIQLFGNHSASTSAVSFSPDGDILVSGDGSGLAIMWDVSESGQSLGLVAITGQGAVNDLDYLPGENIVASAGGDSTIHFLDGESGNETSDPVVHGQRIEEPVSALAFGNDPSVLASGSENGTIIIWDSTNGAQLFPTLSAMPGGVTSIAFTGDDVYLVAGGESGFTSIWELEEGQQAGPFLPGHSNRINVIAASPNGRFFATGDEDGMIVIRSVVEVQTGQSIANPITADGSASSPVLSMEFAPDSTTLASGFANGVIAIINVASNEILTSTITGQTGGIVAMEFNETGTFLATGSGNGRIRLWSASDLRVVNEYVPTSPRRISSLEFSGDMISSLGEDLSLESWDLLSGSSLVLEHIPIESVNSTTSMESSNTKIAFVFDENKIEIFDLGSGEPLPVDIEHSSPYLGSVSTVSFSPDGWFTTLRPYVNCRQFRL